MNHTGSSAAYLVTPSESDSHARPTEPTVRDRAALSLIPSAQACVVWPWCTVTGDHEMHTSRAVTISQPCGWAVLDARVVAENGRDGGPGLDPFIGYCESDLTSDGLRTEVAKIRAALPRLEALADIVDGSGAEQSTAQVLDGLDRCLTNDEELKATAFADHVRELVGGSGDPTATVEDIAFVIARHRAGKAVRARQALTEFLAEHDITQIAAEGPNGHLLTEPLYFRERDGRRILVTPVGADPAETLEYVRGVFTAQEPPASKARTWSMSTEGGTTVSGHLPAWAEEDPSRTALPDDKLRLHLSDVTHCQAYPGQPMVIDTPFGIDGSREIYEENVFCATMMCSPHASAPVHRVPTVTITVVEDCVIEDLDPQGVTDISAKLRAQADRLDQVAADLAAARADWAENTQVTA